MLKQTNDGLSKVWKVHRFSNPFYGGGKVEVPLSESRIVCLFEGNVSIVDLDGTKGTKSRSLLPEKEAEANPVVCFCCHPTKEEIVVATQKSVLHHYSFATEEGGDARSSSGSSSKSDSTDPIAICMRTIKAGNMPILCMALDPSGTLLATGSADRSVKVWDLAGGFCTHSFKEHTDIVRLVQFYAPLGGPPRLVSCGEDNCVRVFDLSKSKAEAALREHVSLPTAVAVSADGVLLASCGRDKVVNVYLTRKYVHLQTVPILEELEALVFLSKQHGEQILTGGSEQIRGGVTSSNVLVTAGGSGVLKFFHLVMAGTFSITPLLHFPLSPALRGLPGRPQVTLGDAHTRAGQGNDVDTLRGVSSLHYLPSTQQLLTVTKEYNLCSYDISAFPQYLKQLHAAANSSDLQSIEPASLLIGSQGEILDLALIPPIKGAGGPLGGMCFRLAMVTNSSQVRVIDERFSCTLLEGHRDIVLSVAASPDGLWLVTSSKDHQCRVWSLGSRQCVAVCVGHTDAVGAVTLSTCPATYASRGAFVVSGGADKILKRWALPVHALDSKQSALSASHSVRAHDKDINSVALSPNDALVASASQDKTVRLWRTTDLSPVATLRGHKRGVWKVAFSPVDKVLASCAGDRTVRLWSAVDHVLLRTFEGHTASVLAVKFVNRGAQLLSAGADGLIRLWTVRTGECEATLDEHSDRIWALECLETDRADPEQGEGGQSGGLFFFSGGSDSRLVLWKDATEEDALLQMREREDALVVEQQMQNHMRAGHYGKALKAALELGHSLKVLQILTAILEADKPPQSSRAGELVQKPFESDWSRRLDPYVRSFSPEQLDRVASYLPEWNTNARYCYPCQMLLYSLLRVARASELVLRRPVVEALPALLSYSQRHYQRLDRLQQASYLLGYFTSKMALLPQQRVERGQKRVERGPVSDMEVEDEDDDEEDLPVLFAPLQEREEAEEAEMSMGAPNKRSATSAVGSRRKNRRTTD